MKALGTIIVIIIVAIAAVVGFADSGIYDVAATAPDMRLVHWLLSTTRDHSVLARSRNITPPADLAHRDIADAFACYDVLCRQCHGGPGIKRGEIGSGLNPEPPKLRESAQELPPGAIFWIVQHGIKMTGMPTFGATHTEPEIWNMVSLVTRFPELNEQGYRELEQRYAGQVRQERERHEHSHPAAGQ
jgi:mono/diheme cytochrome c family protein